MKIKDIRDLSIDELQNKRSELVEEYFNLRIRHTSAQLESPASIGLIRKDIARVKTVLAEKGVK